MKNQYLLVTVLFYCVSFLLVYISSITYSRLKKIVGQRANHITGIVLGFSIAVLSIGTNIFCQKWQPDGRFILIYLSVIFLGPTSGLITLGIGLLSGVVVGYEQMQLLIVASSAFYLTGFIVRYFYKNCSYLLKVVKIVLGSTIAVTVASVFVNMMPFHQIKLSVINDNLGLVYLVTIVLVAGLAMIFIIQEIQEYNYKMVENVVAATYDGFCHYSIRNDKLTISSRFYEILGYDKTDISCIRQRIIKFQAENDQLIYEEDYGVAKKYVSELFSGEISNKQIKIRMKCKTGEIKWVSLSAKLTYDNQGVSDVLVIIKDIHDACEMKSEINRLMYHDDDTGIKNQHAYLNARFESKSIIVFLVFQQYITHCNFFGKIFKRDIKRYIANTLKELFSNAMDIYYLERGIFAISYNSEHSCETITEILEEKINQQEFTITYNETEIDIRFLSTIFKCIGNKDESDELFVRANAVFELHKEVYSNRYIVFNEEMFEKSQLRGKVCNLLNGALKYNELSVVFQPQHEEMVSLPIAFEALLRWYNKDLGQVAPDYFIPVAESMGQIGAIDQYVVRESCRFIKRYNEAFNQQASVSVNISFVELIDPHFASDIIKIADSENVDPRLLRIEITETSIVNVVGTVNKNLLKLKKTGFDVHLDDFGTGYSSLNHLVKINVDAIKLDKEFIWEMLENKTTLMLIEGIIELAHKLNMFVIAEGVETVEQYEKLKQLKCDKFQGYYFSKPMSEEALFDKVQKEIINSK